MSINTPEGLFYGHPSSTHRTLDISPEAFAVLERESRLTGKPIDKLVEKYVIKLLHRLIRSGLNGSSESEMEIEVTEKSLEQVTEFLISTDVPWKNIVVTFKKEVNDA